MKTALPRITTGSLHTLVLRGGASSIALKIASMALALAVSAVLARALGAERYGIYVFAVSLVSFLAIPIQVGLPTLMVREIARYRLGEDWRLLRGLRTRADQAVAVLSGLVICTALIIASQLYDGGEGEQFRTMVWALILLPLLSLTRVREASLQGLGRVLIGQIPLMVVLQASLLCMLLLLLWAPQIPLAPPVAMAAHAFSAACALLVSIGLWRRHAPAALRRAEPLFDVRRWLRSVLPLSLLHGFYVINSQTDIIMLGMLGTTEDVGLYKVALASSVLVVFTLTAMNAVIAPDIARLHAGGERRKLQELVTFSAQITMITALPLALILIFFGGPLLSLIFGSEYRASAVALAILCIGQIVNVASGSVALILNMTGYERDTMLGVAAAAIVNIVANGIAIPIWGMTGAAMASALSQITWNTLLYLMVWRRLGISSLAIPVVAVTERKL